MRETNEAITLNGTFTDELTGEVTDLTATHQMNHRNYSIKRLNMKVWNTGYNFALKEVCNSSKDIEIFTMIIENIDGENQFRMSQKKLSEILGISRQKVSTILNKMTKIGLMQKSGHGIYDINPYVVIGTAVKSNEKKEMLQSSWNLNYNIPNIHILNDTGKFIK